MDKEDVTRINNKLDKQTEILAEMKIKLVEEISLLKIANQKIKHSVMTLGVIVLIIVSVEYPKLIKVLRGII